MDDIKALAEKLATYNEAYRSGKPLVSDHEYDTLVEQLRELDPVHPFLHSVEPEKFESKTEVRHPVPMLSIEKAYTQDDLERFVNRVLKEVGGRDILFRVTPKLDGLAGRDDGRVFATRGNGEVGYEISRAFTKGVIPIGGRGRGIGEIVIVQSYFDEHMSEEFEHPRNMVVGIISSDNLNEFAKKALEDEKVHFVPYAVLPGWEGSAEELMKHIKDITADLKRQTDYPIDGMVASVTSEKIREQMGATSHHYRWQVAVKTKGDTAATSVNGIVWQVGRTGNVTPVLEIEPVSLSGATIKRVTAHHAGMVKEKQIGPGAEIEVIRSGEVIPKIEKIITGSAEVVVPETCPSCGEALKWENDFLKCNGSHCPAKVVQAISHWFKTLGNADWFGIKSIEKLVEKGHDSLEVIYSMSEEDFVGVGFGPVQSKNLFEAINISLTKLVEDWRFLAAFGISDLGKGDSRKLLAEVRLEDLPGIKEEEINQIHGFGSITSRAIVKGIAEIKETMHHMLSLGFNLEKTPLSSEGERVDSPIAGKGIVFTGKMKRGSREAMQAEARRLGAKVQTSVSGKTDFLVCGEKTGKSKIEKAEKKGAKIISEEEYYEMMS